MGRREERQLFTVLFFVLKKNTFAEKESEQTNN